MEKIKWCLNVKNGIELVEPNDNLSNVYIKKSVDALRAAVVLEDNRDWEISSCYYGMYFALYSILMKIGIKCENHSCTIEFMNTFLLKYFTEDDVKQINESMKLRIDAQYYADRNISEDKYKILIVRAPKFLVKCKEVLFIIKEEEINNIRKKITSFLQIDKEDK